MSAALRRRLLRHEWRALRADRTLRLLVLLLVPVLAAALWNGARFAEQRRVLATEATAAEADQRVAFRAALDSFRLGATPSTGLDPRNPTILGTAVGAQAVLPLGPLAALAVGQGDLLPTRLQVTTRSADSFLYTDELENPGNLLEGRFDLTFVVVWLLPLVVLGLGYNLLAGEREAGTLALLLSQPIRLRQVLGAKVAVGGGATVALALGVTVAGLAVVGADLLDPTTLLRVGVWATVTTAWALFWFALAVLVNLRGWPSATNAVALATLWLLLVVVAPALVNVVITTRHPVPSRVELVSALRTASNHASTEGAALLARYYDDHPELAPGEGEAEMAEFMARTYAVQDAVAAEVAPVAARFDQQLAAQRTLVQRYQWVLPAVAVHQALTDAAGTGAAAHDRFRAQVLAFHAEWQGYFLPRIFQRRFLTAAEFDAAPRFTIRAEEPADLIAGALPALLGLPFWALIAWLAGRRRRSAHHALRLALLGALLPTAAAADDSRTITATRTVSPMRIDGRLDEPAWAGAPVTGGFRQIEPVQGEPARFPTEVRLLFDDTHLYVGAFLTDTAGIAGRVRGLQRDFGWETNDVFGITVDAFGDGRVGMVFQANRAGVQRDQLVFDGRTFDEEWDGVWRVATTTTEMGWQVEMAIPWTTLRYPTTGAVWRVNFVRTVRGAGEVSGWQPWPRGLSVYHLEYGGDITGLVPPPPARNLRVQPFSVGRRLSQGGASGRTTVTDGDVGLDLKWAVTPRTVLDLTVNTDFAQADVDRQVINLSRFSVFFPERRPFFLENASLFAVGRSGALQPFFSRRIGLDAGGAPVPIHAGARLTSRSNSGQAGALLVHQAGTNGYTGSTIGVGRYSRNLGSGSRIGGLVAVRHNQGGAATASAFNLTGAVDTYLRFSAATYLQGMLSAAADGGGGGDGTAGYLWIASRGPRGYLGWIQEYVGRSYHPASGFVRQQNYILTSPAGWLDFRPAWRPAAVRSFEPGFVASVYHRGSDARFLEAQFTAYPVFVRFHDNTTVRLQGSYHLQDHEEPFRPLAGVTIAPGRYRYARWSGTVNTAPSRPFSLNVTGTTGQFYDGHLHTLALSGSAVPSPHVSFLLSYTHNALRGVGTGGTDADAWILAPELRLALNPRVQLTTLYQYSSTSRLGVWNARLAWEFRPLSYLYLVFNDRRPYDEPAPTASPTAERQLLLKVTWLGQL